MKKPPKLKKGAWFYKVRGSYLPGTRQAWLLYIPYVTFLVLVFVYAMYTQDSVGGALSTISAPWVIAAVVMTWIAAHKS